MNPKNYDALIARIRIHCQQTSLDVGGGSGWTIINVEDYSGWYVDERKSFLALKRGSERKEPALAFLPATDQQIRETEQQLGFPLPLLLRLLYTEVGNGGFGPGYGIIGAIHGYPGLEDLDGNIAQRYHQEIDEANERRQRLLAVFLEPDRNDQKVKQRTGNQQKGKDRIQPDGTLAPEWEQALPPLWPEGLLPLCEWGHGANTYINTNTGQIFQGVHGPDLFVAPSLEEWLDRWLAGEDLPLW